MAMNKNAMKRLRYRRTGISENNHVGNSNIGDAMDDVANRQLENFLVLDVTQFDSCDANMR